MDRLDGFNIKLMSGTSEADVNINEYFTVFYIPAGTKRYFINNCLYNLGTGDAVLISEGDINNDCSTSAQLQNYYMLTFSMHLLNELSDMLSFDGLENIFKTKKISVPEADRTYFEELLSYIVFEYYQKSDSYSLYFLKLYVSEFLVHLFRYSGMPSLPTSEPNSQETRICEVCRYICNYYNESITLSQMAKLAYMSPTYFSKKFKKVTGFGFNEYLNFVRVKIAVNMLVQTNHSITEIAVYCGYQDSNYFGDVFRRIVGMSPSKYRKTHPKTH